MFRWFSLLLLFSFIKYSEITTAGNILIPVTGQKGENATLPCDIEARETSHVVLSSRSKNIPVCEEKNCSGRVIRKGSCDIVIKDLSFSDAGKYILKVHYTNNHKSGSQNREYHLQIHDEISVKEGEQLKLDVLLTNADKVERNSSGEWTVLWTRGHGVSTDGLTDRDGNLTIKEFTANDTGSYRVLDSNNVILITVTVTESTDSGSSGERKDDSEHAAVYWFCSVGLPLILLVLVGVIVSVYIKKCQCLKRLYSRPSEQNAEEPNL